MDVAIFLLLFLLACGVLGGVRQLLLYPARLNQWRFAFSNTTTYREARWPLRQARCRRRKLKSKHHREVSDAENSVNAAEKTGRQRIRELEKQRDERLRPGRGDLVGALGELQLYEHELVFLKRDPAEEDSPNEHEVMQLAGLEIESLPASENTIIVVTRQDGQKRNATFPRPPYKEAEVLNFAIQIHNNARKDGEFRNEATEIDTYITQVRADVAAEVDAARRNVDQLQEVQRTDPERIQADDAWENQCQVWQAQTGRWPRWWWRW